jgi:hypothetical protein
MVTGTWAALPCVIVRLAAGTWSVYPGDGVMVRPSGVVASVTPVAEAWTASGYVPTGDWGLTTSLMVAVVADPDRTYDDHSQVTSVGRPVTESVTSPENPPPRWSVTVMVAASPVARDTDVCEIEIVIE